MLTRSARKQLDDEDVEGFETGEKDVKKKNIRMKQPGP